MAMAAANDANTKFQEVLKNFKKDKPVNIFVTGKTGNGKSSLINAIIGEGYDKPTEGKCLGGTTRDVTHYSIKVNGVQFNIWDSPGLQDITEEDDQIIEKITTKLKQECNDIHLFLYCLRMDTDRIQNGDKLAIKMLTDNCFGPKIWEVSVFALTYANKVSPPPEKDTDDLAPIYFKQRQEEYKQNIIEILKECKIDKKKASEIAVIPTGYHTVTRSTPNPYVLPDRDDWFNPFWIACADRMKTTALVPLISSQGDRMELVQQKSPEQQNSPEQQSRNAENPELQSHKKPIYILENSSLWMKLKAKAKCVVL